MLAVSRAKGKSKKRTKYSDWKFHLSIIYLTSHKSDNIYICIYICKNLLKKMQSFCKRLLHWKFRMGWRDNTSNTKESGRQIHCKFSKNTFKMIYLLSLNILHHDILMKRLKGHCGMAETWQELALVRTDNIMCISSTLFSGIDKESTFYMLRYPKRTTPMTLHGESDTSPWYLEGTWATGWVLNRNVENKRGERASFLDGELKWDSWFRISLHPRIH